MRTYTSCAKVMLHGNTVRGTTTKSDSIDNVYRSKRKNTGGDKLRVSVCGGHIVAESISKIYGQSCKPNVRGGEGRCGIKKRKQIHRRGNFVTEKKGQKLMKERVQEMVLLIKSCVEGPLVEEGNEEY